MGGGGGAHRRAARPCLGTAATTEALKSAPAFRVYNKAIVVDTKAVVNLHASSKKRGLVAAHMQSGSVKGCMLVYASGGCSNCQQLAPAHLAMLRVAKEETINALMTNATLPNRSDGGGFGGEAAGMGPADIKIEELA